MTQPSDPAIDPSGTAERPVPAFTVLTLNAGLTAVDILGVRFYEDARHLDARAAALAPALRSVAADIVALQEVLTRRAKRRLAAALHDLYPHAAGVEEDSHIFGSGLLILSRFPVDDRACLPFASQMFDERVFAPRSLLACTVDVPVCGPCRVATLHTTAGGALRPFADRRTQRCRASQLADVLRQVDGAAGHAATILAGDFNCGPTVVPDLYRSFLDAGFRDAHVEVNGSDESAGGGTWDPANPLNAAAAARTAHRIDHVFLREPGPARLRAARAALVLQEPCVALDDGRVIPISDHYGLLVAFSPTEAD